MKTAPMGRRVRRLQSSASRCWMVLVAVISLLPMLSPYVHLLLVQHVTCPEHGELIDRPASDLAQEAASRLVPVGTPSHPAWHALDSDDPHRHSHCAFVLNRRPFVPTPTAIGAAVVPMVEHLPGFVRLDVRPVSEIAVFRLAPKQSPPA